MIIDFNMVMSGFVSKVVNDCGDILKSKIKSADRDRKLSEQNIETRIYQVMIDAVNEFTVNTYQQKDILYDAVESMLNGLKCKKDKYDAVKAGLKMMDSQLTDDRYRDFLGKLCGEICKDENDILYKEIILLQQQQTQEEMHKGFAENIQNHAETHRKLAHVMETLNNKKVQAAEHYEIHAQNKAEEYAKKWDKNVFLNNFKKRDKNAGANIKLRNVYLDEHLPHYTWKMDNEVLFDLKELLKEYIVDSDDKEMLLILGQPGIGKSTLITWIMAHFPEKQDDILVYQFASDLKDINWQDDNILTKIFEALDLNYEELESKVLILDGFDEINAGSNRERILNRINQELSGMNVLENFSVVITCRENYVHQLKQIECDFITLQMWDDEQIKSFCEVYEKGSGNNISKTKIDKITENKEVFGIPLILYMVLALDVAIEKSESLVDVYDQIFSLNKSSIYDRCIENSRYGNVHRISEEEIKRQIHQVSQRIAFWIFENNSEKGFIPQKEYEKICDDVISKSPNGNKIVKNDFMIGNYFKLKHCDGVGSEELQFVHRSIYEYFVVVYFFESLCNLSSKEEAAGTLGALLKDGHLSLQILQFIKYKFAGLKMSYLSVVTRDIFQVMLHDGMTFHIKGKYKNILEREMNIFSNMLEVVHLWNSKIENLDNRIVYYLRYNHLFGLNLRGANLSRADLCGVDLRGADLKGASLNGANLIGVNLGDTNLIGADLRGINLYGANLGRANLNGTNLNGAYLKEANLNGAGLSRADLIGVNLNRANLRGANLNGADLSRADLREADLREVNLGGANLRGAILNGADLKGAILDRANLKGANLREVDLIEINLGRADLNGVEKIKPDLRGAIFDACQVDMLHENYDMSNINIFISETSEIISYQEYCLRKQN